jgi:hypothetical protein
LTEVVGGATFLDSDRPGSTMKLVELRPVPPGVVTPIGPVEAATGTVAVILVSEFTVLDVAAAPLKVTAVAPVNPVPLMVTMVPMVPDVGVNEVMVGAVA